MKLKVRELQSSDIESVVDYFHNADSDFLKGMGADKSKLPGREAWIERLELELDKPYNEKEFYYIIWLLENVPVGHSNVSHIEYERTAVMHLHLWDRGHRQSGLGLSFLKLAILYFFEHLLLEKLVSEPYAKNVAPNKTLDKLGFELVRTYRTTPGWINFEQVVNRYELTREKFELRMGKIDQE